MHNVGIDIIEISRIKKAIAHRGDVFLNRIYTETELRLYRNKPLSLAARFAGKEAVIKALGAKNKGISWREIEILSDVSGKPLISLFGKAEKQARALSLHNLVISLSHSREYAVAFVCDG
ncbi:holo-ACP synthase [Chloroflexota bacterium]